ncbi:hypothetical protein EYE40_10970 [Glaciihabitans arcticus]|uniref:Uncharacterized protein n=1 Tax=Glaciihabitans arcticus TaxID=2668039 RepID=A0A4Q9GZP0_9MICO|nr:hypothetical protein [Glaciihabitans arcticus]TBN57870.1 hypothetical protein EYE40_10970 [Glaciihabitans arcticus]
MKLARATPILLLTVVLAGCATVPEPDDEALDRFGAALAEELQGIDGLQMNPRADEGELIDRIAGLSIVNDVFLSDAPFETVAAAATSVSNGNQTVLDSAVTIDDWEVLDNTAESVTVSYDVHFTRSLQELDGDAWEEVIPYEVTFDQKLSRVNSIVIRDLG